VMGKHFSERVQQAWVFDEVNRDFFTQAVLVYGGFDRANELVYQVSKP